MEIVADAGRFVLLRFSDGIETRLPVVMDMTVALEELQTVGVSSKPKKSFWQHLASVEAPLGATYRSPI